MAAKLVTMAAMLMACLAPVAADAQVDELPIRVFVTPRVTSEDVILSLEVRVSEGELSFVSAGFRDNFRIFILGPEGWVWPLNNARPTDWQGQGSFMHKPITITPERPLRIKHRLSQSMDVLEILRQSGVYQVNVKFYVEHEMEMPVDSGPAYFGIGGRHHPAVVLEKRLEDGRILIVTSTAPTTQPSSRRDRHPILLAVSLVPADGGWPALIWEYEYQPPSSDVASQPTVLDVGLCGDKLLLVGKFAGLTVVNVLEPKRRQMVGHAALFRDSEAQGQRVASASINCIGDDVQRATVRLEIVGEPLADHLVVELKDVLQATQ